MIAIPSPGKSYSVYALEKMYEDHMARVKRTYSHKSWYFIAYARWREEEVEMVDHIATYKVKYEDRRKIEEIEGYKNEIQKLWDNYHKKGKMCYLATTHGGRMTFWGSLK